jgi:glycosyltransferase involved in cell wall biosynthesis
MVLGFSVIIPTYNQATFIRNAIGSLFAQTYEDWELIIVNDGCTDNTEEFIADYLDNHKIKYVKNDYNQGLGYSINRGLDLVKYDHIAYLPSDDFYYPDHLETLRQTFNSMDDLNTICKMGNGQARRTTVI